MKARSCPALLAFIDQVTAHNYKIAYYYKTFLEHKIHLCVD